MERRLEHRRETECVVAANADDEIGRIVRHAFELMRDIAERTYAAWIRTGLVSLAAGVGAKKTLGGVLPEWAVVLTGSVLAAFAAFCFVAAV